MEGRYVQLFQVHSIHSDGARVRIIQSHQETGQGALTSTRVTNHCCNLPWSQTQGHVPDHLQEEGKRVIEGVWEKVDLEEEWYKLELGKAGEEDEKIG